VVLDNPLSMVTSHCSLPVVLLSVAVTHNRRSTIPRSSLHPLPAALLQRSTHWDSQGLDETRLFRMPQLVWCLGLIAVTMPCHYYATFIGCQWDCKLSSKLLSSFGSVSTALLQSTCKSYALKWSGTASVVVPDYGLRQLAASSYQECKHLLHSGALLAMDRQCGTV